MFLKHVKLNYNRKLSIPHICTGTCYDCRLYLITMFRFVFERHDGYVVMMYWFGSQSK